MLRVICFLIKKNNNSNIKNHGLFLNKQLQVHMASGENSPGTNTDNSSETIITSQKRYIHLLFKILSEEF